MNTLTLLYMFVINIQKTQFKLKLHFIASVGVKWRQAGDCYEKALQKQTSINSYINYFEGIANGDSDTSRDDNETFLLTLNKILGTIL